jgi:hypothetical protein
MWSPQKIIFIFPFREHFFKTQNQNHKKVFVDYFLENVFGN